MFLFQAFITGIMYLRFVSIFTIVLLLYLFLVLYIIGFSHSLPIIWGEGLLLRCWSRVPWFKNNMSLSKCHQQIDSYILEHHVAYQAALRDAVGISILLRSKYGKF